MNGRSDGKYADVYMCKKCDNMGYALYIRKLVIATINISGRIYLLYTLIKSI
jgi:hypothetical protein